MNYKLDDKGIALVTVLLQGLIVMALVGIAFYIGLVGTQMSGTEKRYITELDAAKGTADYVMASLRNASLSCNGGNPCVGNATPCGTVASTIDLNTNVCQALGKNAACDNVEACFISSTVDIDGYITFSSLRVTSTNGNSGENAIIDFVYKIDDTPP